MIDINNGFIVKMIDCALAKMGKPPLCQEKDVSDCVKNLQSSDVLLFTQFYQNFSNSCYYLKILKWEERNFRALHNLYEFTERLQDTM